MCIARRFPRYSDSAVGYRVATVDELQDIAYRQGTHMLDTYLRLKRSEVAAYAGMDADAIAAEYRYKF